MLNLTGDLLCAADRIDMGEAMSFRADRVCLQATDIFGRVKNARLRSKEDQQLSASIRFGTADSRTIDLMFFSEKVLSLLPSTPSLFEALQMFSFF